MKTEISVIIPVYNTKQYLDKCIQSVLNQSYQNFEVILVDDGSTDGSEKICDEYQTRYQNIQVLHCKNSGPAAARETGVREAKGQYIMFVDSDDWIDKEMLEILYNELREADADIVCCHYVDIDSRGNRKTIKTFTKNYMDCTTPDESMKCIHELRNFTTGPWAKLYKSILFEKLNFYTDVTIGEDYAMIIQLAEKAKKVRLLNQVLYYRLVRRDNISHSGYTSRHTKALDNYIQIRNYLSNKYKNLEVSIIGYHIEYEMAVMTAMCRNNTYDKRVLNNLRSDLKANMKLIILKSHMPFYMKVCAILIAYFLPIFIIVFRVIHLLTGR